MGEIFLTCAKTNGLGRFPDQPMFRIISHKIQAFQSKQWNPGFFILRFEFSLDKVFFI